MTTNLLRLKSLTDQKINSNPRMTEASKNLATKKQKDNALDLGYIRNV